jgi:phage portal protein BeeE
MDYKQLGMSNQDAEWLASRRFTIEDIARMFNVSPIFLQEYSNSTYSNFSEASRAFLTMTMRPWLANFEQANQICVAGGLSCSGNPLSGGV